jgi:hypothetical protein
MSSTADAGGQSEAATAATAATDTIVQYVVMRKDLWAEHKVIDHR